VSGFVYLVGAGPGDPRLLTVRALELLQSAEVVAHDALVSAAVLALAPAGAERLAVGRRAGQGATAALHPAVLAQARAGRTVVRLKGGDPLIFGRGAEEAEALAAAGIPFEIVPGITAAQGAAAYAGIPLTDRRHATRIVLATGHSAAAERQHAAPELPAAAPRTDHQPGPERGPRGGGTSQPQRSPGGSETAVLYMASQQLADNLAALIAAGWPRATPAAWVAAATTPAQRVVTGTLDDLPQRLPPGERGVPALVIVGQGVRLRERLAWFERRPLRGRRLLLARARPGHSTIAARLRALGAEVIEAPRVTVAALADCSRLDAALRCLDAYQGLLFGCSSGVDAVLARHPPGEVPLVAVGAAANQALRRWGRQPALVLPGACRAALEAAAPRLRGRPWLLITAEGGRPGLQRELRELRIATAEAPAYRRVHHMPALAAAPLDALVLPSSSAARLVLGSPLGPALRDVPAVTIGPRSAAAARDHGARQVVCSASDELEAVIAGVLALLCPAAPWSSSAAPAGAALATEVHG
jgi:uroporphyrinogen III methyltransferase/synthase